MAQASKTGFRVWEQGTGFVVKRFSLEKLQEVALSHAISVATHVHVVRTPAQHSTAHGTPQHERVIRNTSINPFLLGYVRQKEGKFITWLGQD